MSLRTGDLYNSRAQQSPALAASMRLSSLHDNGYRSASAYSSTSHRQTLGPINDLEHLELRQDLVDRESILALQQQRERLHEVEDLMRQKENEVEMAKMEALKGTARVDALEGALARTSARKTLLEKELADKSFAIEQERRLAESLRKEKQDLTSSIGAYRQRCDDAEARLRDADYRFADLSKRNAALERKCTDMESQLRGNDALRARLVDAEREIADLRLRLGQLEKENLALRKDVDFARNEAAFERQKRAELADKLAAADQLAAQRATDAYRLEQEVRARDALLHVKDSELESSKRLQDALARENYDSKRRCEDAERESRAAKSDLMREINDRAERARSRLQILERRALEEDLVSNNVDHIYALTYNANNRSVSNSALNYSQYNSGLGASNRPPIHSIASPIAVSRASGNMSKEQIRSLITNIDRSLVGN